MFIIQNADILQTLVKKIDTIHTEIADRLRVEGLEECLVSVSGDTHCPNVRRLSSRTYSNRMIFKSLFLFALCRCIAHSPATLITVHLYVITYFLLRQITYRSCICQTLFIATFQFLISRCLDCVSDVLLLFTSHHRALLLDKKSTVCYEWIVQYNNLFRAFKQLILK